MTIETKLATVPKDISNEFAFLLEISGYKITKKQLDETKQKVNIYGIKILIHNEKSQPKEWNNAYFGD